MATFKATVPDGRGKRSPCATTRGLRTSPVGCGGPAVLRAWPPCELTDFDEVFVRVAHVATDLRAPIVIGGVTVGLVSLSVAGIAVAR